MDVDCVSLPDAAAAAARPWPKAAANGVARVPRLHQLHVPADPPGRPRARLSLFFVPFID